jgi:ribosome biogenesis GTPase
MSQAAGTTPAHGAGHRPARESALEGPVRVPADSLDALGWSPRWADLLRAVPGAAIPGRVVRHDGVALVVAGRNGIDTAPLGMRLDPRPTIGDWVALVDGQPVAVLERVSLLRRRAAGDVEQALAANVDVVFLVCGLDRPVKAGRIQRGATVAADAGATPVVVLTKAVQVDDAQAIADEVRATSVGIEVIVTSVREGVGVGLLRAVARGKTVALLGESGAGKSSIVNALLGRDVAAVGAVRPRDRKGRQTTTTRFLHQLPGGGTVIDSPGIRSVGIWSDADAVADTFADIAALADGCRFVSCRHDTEPDCAVKAGIAEGTLTPERLASWRALDQEIAANARRNLAASRPQPRRGRSR